MKLTGKCKEEFEKWLLLKHIGRDSFVVPRITIENTIIEFEKFDPSMQYGVLVDYFDSVGIDLANSKISFDGAIWFCSVVNNVFINTNNGMPINHFNTREEARTAAIQKANEIYNQNK